MFNASFVKGDLATSWCGHPKARHADMAQMLFRCLDIKISIQFFLRRFTTSHWCHLCCLLDEYWYSYSSHILHIISEPCWISESLMTIHQQAQLQAALHSGWWWCSQRSLATGVCLEIPAWWTMIGGAVGWGKVCLAVAFPKMIAKVAKEAEMNGNENKSSSTGMGISTWFAICPAESLAVDLLRSWSPSITNVRWRGFLGQNPCRKPSFLIWICCGQGRHIMDHNGVRRCWFFIHSLSYTMLTVYLILFTYSLVTL